MYVHITLNWSLLPARKSRVELHTLHQSLKSRILEALAAVHVLTQINVAAVQDSLRGQLKRGLRLEPPRGFEPRTYALRVRCSTPELRRQTYELLTDRIPKDI